MCFDIYIYMCVYVNMCMCVCKDFILMYYVKAGVRGRRVSAQKGGVECAVGA